MLKGLEIRLARYEDLKDVARINTIAWKKAYVGQLSQEYLDSLIPETKQKRWETTFADDLAANKKTLLATRGGETVGYIAFGPCRDPRFTGSAEIYATYLLPDEWGTGVGYRLFGAAVSDLKSNGFSKLYVLALDTNSQALKAYTRWGGALESSLVYEDTIGGKPVKEVAVRFDLITLSPRPIHSTYPKPN